MAKRLRSWDGDFERQLKVFIINKTAFSSNASYMNTVYERTNDLLFNGANPIRNANTTGNHIQGPNVASSSYENSDTDSDESSSEINMTQIKRKRSFSPSPNEGYLSSPSLSPIFPLNESDSTKIYKQLRLDQLWLNAPPKDLNQENKVNPDEDTKPEPETFNKEN